MTIILGLVVMLGCMLGGYVAMGGYVSVLWQPWEFVIILGTSLGTFIVANPMKVIKDTGKGLGEAFGNAAPSGRQYLDVMGLLYSLMRELRSKPRNEVEKHIDLPEESPIFQKFATVLNNKDLTTFICDYCRLIIIGNARTHEVEALMDEEIQTLRNDKLKAYHAITNIADGLPAIGIIAAVLGVIKTMGAITEPPEVLGHLIGSVGNGDLRIANAGGARPPDRRGARRHIRRHLLLLRRVRAARDQGEGRPREADAPLHRDQADAARVHERRHAAGRGGIRA